MRHTVKRFEQSVMGESAIEVQSIYPLVSEKGDTHLAETTEDTCKVHVHLFNIPAETWERAVDVCTVSSVTTVGGGG